MSISKYFFRFLSGLVLPLACASCVMDDDLGPCPQDDPSGSVHPEEYVLSFKISLKSLQNGSRAATSAGVLDESYEDYVDPSRLYVMFFLKNNYDSTVVEEEEDTDDYFLYRMFPPSDPKVSVIPVAYEMNDEYDKNWHVRIAVSEMTDAQEFADMLRSRPFKIAVVANADPSSSISMDPAVTNPESGYVTLGSDINRLHHQTGDEDPFSELSSVFGFLYSGNPHNSESKVMGFYSDWVTSNSDFSVNDNPASAAEWIRSNWNPDGSFRHGSYSDLWLLWNFGGISPDNRLPYTSFASEWYLRNGSDLSSLLTSHDAELEDFSTSESVPLSFRQFTSSDKATAVVSDGYYGIRLPAHPEYGNGGGTYTKFRTAGTGCLTFMAPASGHLNITARAAYGSLTKVVAQVGYSANRTEYSFGSSVSCEPGVIVNNNCGITTNGAQPVYIFTDSDSPAPAEIFQIEFIEDDYLAATDRSGVHPKDQPIPMYGIQKFDKLVPWLPGTSFDLNDYHVVGDVSYSYKPVPLLRSVAKVEVQIPSSMHAKEVFLRNSNRLARWEPSDVRSNTLTYWTDDHLSFTQAPAAEEYCEWFYMLEQPVFFNSSSGDNYTLNDYQSKVAWFYGDWASSGSVGGVTPDRTVNTTLRFSYPHIMNPLPSVNDFTAFIRAAASTDGDYDRYVLYVGEKFIEDPSSFDNLATALPQVCHIEFRAGEDPVSNLDDDNCYRIYFTDGGFNSSMTIPSCKDEENTWEKTYEQDTPNLQKHWPIMRNHYYRFTVKDVRQQIAIVNVQVVPWKKVTDIELDF